MSCKYLSIIAVIVFGAAPLGAATLAGQPCGSDASQLCRVAATPVVIFDIVEMVMPVLPGVDFALPDIAPPLTATPVFPSGSGGNTTGIEIGPIEPFVMFDPIAVTSLASVSLPAAGWLLLAGLGGFAAVTQSRRRG